VSDPAAAGEPSRGALIRAFSVDRNQERAVGRLRQVAAVLAALGSFALLLGELPLTVGLVALIGLLISLFWWRTGSRAVREADAANSEGLWLYAEGLRLTERGSERWVAWEELERVWVDEERLTVVLEQRGGDPVTLEPRYADVAVDDLARALTNAAGLPDPDGSQMAPDDIQ
jgi:hypothetical protein